MNELSWKDLANALEKHKPNIMKQMSLAQLTYITRDLNAQLAALAEKPAERPADGGWSKEQWKQNAIHWNNMCVEAWEYRDRAWEKIDLLEAKLAERPTGGSIPKIPDSPDTRHAVHTMPLLDAGLFQSSLVKDDLLVIDDEFLVRVKTRDAAIKGAALEKAAEVQWRSRRGAIRTLEPEAKVAIRALADSPVSGETPKEEA